MYGRSRIEVEKLQKYFAAFAFLFLCITSAEAQSIANTDLSQNTKLKTIPLGFGGAYRALADSNSALLLNPAGIAQKKGTMTASGDYVQSGYLSSKLLSASVVDFKASEYVAMGLEYDWNSFTIGNDIVLNQVTVAAAVPIGEMIYVGSAVKGYFTKVDSLLIADPNGIDMDVGMLVKPIQMISLALTLDNLFRGANNNEYPLLLGFGAALNLSNAVRLAIDAERNFQTPSPNKMNAYFGGELRLAEGIFARGGFGLDKIRDDNFYAIGAVIAGPQISLNFTFTQRLNPKSTGFGGSIEFSF